MPVAAIAKLRDTTTALHVLELALMWEAREQRDGAAFLRDAAALLVSRCGCGGGGGSSSSNNNGVGDGGASGCNVDAGTRQQQQQRQHEEQPLQHQQQTAVVASAGSGVPASVNNIVAGVATVLWNAIVMAWKADPGLADGSVSHASDQHQQHQQHPQHPQHLQQQLQAQHNTSHHRDHQAQRRTAMLQALAHLRAVVVGHPLLSSTAATTTAATNTATANATNPTPTPTPTPPSINNNSSGGDFADEISLAQAVLHDSAGDANAAVTCLERARVVPNGLMRELEVKVLLLSDRPPGDGADGIGPSTKLLAYVLSDDGTADMCDGGGGGGGSGGSGSVVHSGQACAEGVTPTTTVPAGAGAAAAVAVAGASTAALSKVNIADDTAAAAADGADSAAALVPTTFTTTATAIATATDNTTLVIDDAESELLERTDAATKRRVQRCVGQDPTRACRQPSL